MIHKHLWFSLARSRFLLDGTGFLWYTLGAMEQVAMDRRTGDGKYNDVIDVCEELGRGDHGSATNALAVMARQSELFAVTLARLKTNGKQQAN